MRPPISSTSAPRFDQTKVLSGCAVIRPNVSDRKRLVELKVRYEDPGKARALLAGSEHVGSYRQTDTYFALGERRLKIREAFGRPVGQLVYYERPDRPGVKESEVLRYEAVDPSVLKERLARTSTGVVATQFPFA